MVERNPITSTMDNKSKARFEATTSSNLSEEEKERIWKENYFHKDKKIRRMWRITSNGKYGIR